MAQQQNNTWVSYRVLIKHGTDLEYNGPNIERQDQFLVNVLKPLTEVAAKIFALDGYIYTTYPTDRSYRMRSLTGMKPEFGDEPYQYVTVRFRVTEDQKQASSNYLNQEFEKAQINSNICAFKRIDDWGDKNPACYDDFGGCEIADLIDDYLIQISRITLELMSREREMAIPNGFPSGEKRRMFLYAHQWAHILFRQFGFLDEPINAGISLHRFR